MPVRTRAKTLLLLAAAVIGFSRCSDPVAPPVLLVTAVNASNGQIGVVSTALPQSLRVRVLSDGAPKAGVIVTWDALDGSVAPASTPTNAAGIAATSWTLGDVPGVMVVSARVAGAQGSPVTFRATALAPSQLAVTAVPATDDQTGTVGTPLSQSLRVKVQSNGAPKAGVTVRWQTSDGSLTQDSSLTNAAGVASMHWTLGTESKVMNVTASVADAYGSPVTFRANAVPGPAFAVSRIPGDGSTLAVNQRIRLIAQVTDRYSNRVEGQTVIWQVQSGPVAFATIGGATDPSGESVAIVVPSGTQGAAVVRATLPGSTASVDFNLTITPRSWDVTLSTSPLQFISRQNGSSHPAVDTIPAGETMRWTLTTYNYDEHSLVSVGNPSFVGGDFPYAARSSVSVTFTTPGTYQYTDFFYPGATGFVVVQ